MKRWGEHRSVWNCNVKKKSFDPLQRDVDVDTVVVGAGITGLTTAYMLVEAGQKVAIVTDGAIGDGTTGSSTGHLTEVFDERFEDLISDFGKQAMQNVVGSVHDSITTIEKITALHQIDCDFQRLNGYKFSENLNDQNELKKELSAAKSLGLKGQGTQVNLTRFSTSNAIVFENQAQFDPLKYIYGLASVLAQMGCQIFEDSRVIRVEDGEPGQIRTPSGSVTAKNIVLATHTPVGLYFSLQTRLAPYFSYVIAARLQNPPAPGLYWDTSDPYFYFRPYQAGSDIWIIGGRDHKTGQEEHPYERYLQLENYIQDHFDVKEMVSYWGDELYESVDGLPYVGKIPFTKALYTGTGFAGTGLTWGTVSAQVLSDEILGKENPCASIYSPSRIKPIASATSFVKENLNVAMHFVGDRFSHSDLTKLSVIPPQEGRVVDLDGKKVAAYRDVTDHIHMFSATCTHLGCTVAWNNADKSWDCPCHGGRFKCTGQVFEGPPMKDLDAIGVEALGAQKLLAPEPVGALGRPGQVLPDFDNQLEPG